MSLHVSHGLHFLQTILNHCFDDIERFMGRLQQTAEAQGILDQRNKKKKSKKSKNKADFNGRKTSSNLWGRLKNSPQIQAKRNLIEQHRLSAGYLGGKSLKMSGERRYCSIQYSGCRGQLAVVLLLASKI